MPRAPTAKRYAQAAFEIAREHNEIDRWLEDLQAALPVLEDQTFRSYLGLPTVKSEVKLRAIGSALGDVNPLVRTWLLFSHRGTDWSFIHESLRSTSGSWTGTATGSVPR